MITWLYDNKQYYPSITHTGYNKTLATPLTRPQVETHVLHQNIDLYGQEVQVIFLQKIREEKKFAHLEELKQAIALDKAKAQTWFTRHSAKIMPDKIATVDHAAAIDQA